MQSKRVGTDKLNDKQRAFVKEYLIDKNATKAYIRAGYEARGNSAENRASQLLGNAKIQKAIDRELKFRMEKVEITAEKVLQEVAGIAFADVNDYVVIEEQTVFDEDEEGMQVARKEPYVRIKPTEELTPFQRKAIKKIKQGPHGVEIELHDKNKALEMLGKNLALFVERTEVSGVNGEQIQIQFNIPRPTNNKEDKNNQIEG